MIPKFKMGDTVSNGNGVTGRVITLPVARGSESYIVLRADGRAFLVAGSDLSKVKSSSHSQYDLEKSSTLKGFSK